MAPRLTACALLALTLCSVQALDFHDFITDPKYGPFLQKASGECLSDPAVSDGTFDLDQCPSLLAMLDATNQGATDFPVECESNCARVFYALQPDCLAGLTQNFNQDPSPIGVLGSRFLDECAALHESLSSGNATVPAPAPAPAAM